MHVYAAERTEAAPGARPADYGAGHSADFANRGRDDPFVVLPAEETPPDGIQAAEGLWGMVTVDGSPVAFVSPEVVGELDPGRRVGWVFENLDRAYVARFAREPRRFFEAELGAPAVSGQVVVLDEDFAQTFGEHVTLSEFAAARCLYGQIVPAGAKCGRCMRPCERATG